MSKHSILRWSTSLTLCAVLATAASAQTCFTDSFTGPNGSSPNGAYWVADPDCSQGNPQNVIKANMLEQSSVLASSCALGCVGNVLHTTVGGSSFDVRVRYMGAASSSPGYMGGEASLGVWGKSHMPPSSICIGATSFPAMAFLHLKVDASGSAHVGIAQSGIAGQLFFSPAQYPVNFGDELRIQGAPGGALSFWLVSGLVEKLIHQEPTWSIPVGTTFVAMLKSQPTALGTDQTVWWDDFSGLFSAGLLCPCSPANTLAASTCVISASQGGTVTFSFDPPTPPYQDNLYLIAGTLSGTTPGVVINNLLVPLNADSYTFMILSAPNLPPFAGFRNYLKAGKAVLPEPTLTIPPAALNPLVGATFHHAALVFNFMPFIGGPGTLSFVSNVLPLVVIP